MKILLVEDHALVREGISLLLPNLCEDIGIFQAGTCQEALNLLDSVAGIDLVLLDLDLPDSHGLETIATVKGRFPEVPVVVLSGSTSASTVREGIRLGAMGYIPKTHSSQLMIGALRLVVLHNGVYLPPNLFLDQPDILRPVTEQTPTTTTRTTPRDIGITPRQADVLYFVLQGKSNKAIGKALNLSDTTVKTHLSAVLRALNVTTRTEAVIKAGQMRLAFEGSPLRNSAS